jgi:hypothetical protein
MNTIDAQRDRRCFIFLIDWLVVGTLFFFCFVLFSFFFVGSIPSQPRDPLVNRSVLSTIDPVPSRETETRAAQLRAAVVVAAAPFFPRRSQRAKTTAAPASASANRARATPSSGFPNRSRVGPRESIATKGAGPPPLRLLVFFCFRFTVAKKKKKKHYYMNQRAHREKKFTSKRCKTRSRDERKLNPD